MSISIFMYAGVNAFCFDAAERSPRIGIQICLPAYGCCEIMTPVGRVNAFYFDAA